MPKIVFIAPSEDIAEMVREIIPELELDVDLRIGFMESGLAIAHSLDKEHTDVIIARGGTASLIKKSNIEIPIVEVPITGEELVCAIKTAGEISGKPNPSIAYIGFDNMVRTIRMFSEIINVNLHIYQVQSSAEIESGVLKAKEDNIDVVIGGILTAEYARKNNMSAVSLGSTKNAVTAAFRIAQEVIYARTLEKKKAQEFKTILDSAFEAIIGMDDRGMITVFNSAAELFFKVSAASVTGNSIMTIPGIIDEKDLKTVLVEGKQLLAKIVNVNNASVVLNFTPIVVDRKIMAAILSFQAIDKIQTVEAKIREELYLKGNVADYTFADIMGQSAMINETKRIAESFAKLDSIVLLFGETGTGKELFAQSIHNASLRSGGPFVAVNCGAIPSSLIESELFGYADGAFTGAKKGGKRGFFEIAHGGTIFLDEISEMDNSGQVMLLRVIQEKQIRRVGDDRVIPVDVRIIAATNRNLMTLVDEKKFRGDLYYRINVLSLSIPPLRDRPNDIEYLLLYFIGEYSKKFYKYVSLSQSAISFLKNLPWYGNVRQMKSFCERLVAIAANKIIDVELVKEQIKDTGCSIPKEEEENTPQKQPVKEFSEDDYSQKIIKLLIQYNGNKKKVADELNISRTTLWRQIKDLNIVCDFTKGE